MGTSSTRHMTEFRADSIVRFISSRGAWLAWVCALASLTAFVAPVQEHLAPVLAWILDLATHWQWAYLLLGLIGTALALLGARRHALWAAALLSATWLLEEPGVPAAANTLDPGATLSVATANLDFNTRDHAPLRAWLAAPQAPDVVVLQEFTPIAAARIADDELKRRYPHRVLAADPGQFGLAILSRLPILTYARIEPADPLDTLKLRLTLQWRGRQVALSAIHPMPPISAEYARARDASIRQEAQLLAQQGMPGILVGDFNATPWSAGMRGVSGTLARASGLTPTWPNVWGWFSVLPLDHVMITTQWRGVSSRRGPDLGSDHRPVVAALALSAP